MRLIAGVIAAVPLFHLWLHGFLNWWRRFPLLLYIWTLAIGLFVIIFFEQVLPPSQVFKTSTSLEILGWLFISICPLVIMWSLFTLGLKRWFAWGVLRPSSVPNIRERSGPFRYIPHPAYTSFLLAAMGLILASGQAYAFGLLIYLLIVLPIVMWLEEKELESRLKEK